MGYTGVCLDMFLVPEFMSQAVRSATQLQNAASWKSEQNKVKICFFPMVSLLPPALQPGQAVLHALRDAISMKSMKTAGTNSTQRVIMHLDMDAFFASVEQVDNPELKGKPVIIGKSMRGVVSAASYEARKYGVHSAMPVAEARRRCPHGIFISGSKDRYKVVSDVVMGILHNFSPLVEQVSVDEAYLDATGLERIFGQPMEMALAMKQAIFNATGLTSSVGIAPNKYLAKVCSDINKPDGIYCLLPEKVDDFLAALPVGKVGGIGRSMVRILADMNVRTMGEVARYSLDFWIDRFGDKGGRYLFSRSLGEDSRR